MAVSMIQKIDRCKLFETLLKIDNKQGIVVPFRPNRMQRYFQQNKGSRNIILKHRQGGMSSYILGDMYLDCITIPHTPCAVVSHETRATQRLLDRVHFYHSSMEDPKPQTGAESRTEITFPELHSSIYIGTAGARAFGRGDTIRKILLSEMSFYEDPETILSGVEDAVPLTGELTIECTPNGEDNLFHHRWVRAREGKSGYKTFFFPWWWTDEYSLPRGSDLVIPADRGELSYTPEELELIRMNNLTEDQIRWRRWKISEKEALFWQEYPEDEVSCFITIGNPVFDTNLLNELAQHCYDGTRHEQGWLYWLPPVEKAHYIIGADSSSGAPEGSFSTAVVLDQNWQVCATFQNRLSPHNFAGILKQLGKWYNDAEIAIERNFTGYAVLEQLTDYPNVFHQRDFTTGKITSQRGWWTNDQTRDLMMTITKEKLPNVKMWDVNLVRQLRSYRYIKLKTKYRETAQTHDDLAIALMIALTVRKVAGISRGYQGSVPGWEW